MAKTTRVPTKRIVSIDALRGFDMFWIIGGDSIFPALFALMGAPWAHALSRQLEHCAWNGFRFYDLIFPLFLFLVGAAMPFSFHSRLSRGDSKRRLWGHIVQRTAILFLLGLIYNGLLDFRFEYFRYAGVLQRIALCYFFAALILLHFPKPKTQALIGGGILILYWGMMKLIPVPGFGPGVLTPEGNLASFIDRMILPGRFCCFEFGDNEGILSTLPAIVSVLIGAQAGHLLRSRRSESRKALFLLLSGAAYLAAGILWNFAFPINKLIWTSSYTLYAGGWSLLLLALFYWIVDIKGWQKWAFPFVVIGMNPITIYVAQGLFDFGSVASIFVHGFIDSLGAIKPLFWALCVFAVKWLFLLFLYRRRIFLKV